MEEECLYCHTDWLKRIPIRDNGKEYIELGKTNKLEIEIEDNSGFGNTVFTSIELISCPKCERWLAGDFLD